MVRPLHTRTIYRYRYRYRYRSRYRYRYRYGGTRPIGPVFFGYAARNYTPRHHVSVTTKTKTHIGWKISLGLIRDFCPRLSQARFEVYSANARVDSEKLMYELVYRNVFVCRALATAAPATNAVYICQSRCLSLPVKPAENSLKRLYNYSKCTNIVHL